MATTAPPLPTPSGAGRSDIHLHVQTERAGRIKGESRDSAHADEIQVVSWNWAVRSTSVPGSTQPRARRSCSYTALCVVKKIDLATTALMSALANNDRVTEARLTMRRAGGGAVDYFSIVLAGARIEQVEHTVDGAGDALERVHIVFSRVEVEYRPQDAAGLAGGGSTFTDELVQS
jgi:type VI secretion system secreted protein Hcp